MFTNRLNVAKFFILFLFLGIPPQVAAGNGSMFRYNPAGQPVTGNNKSAVCLRFVFFTHLLYFGHYLVCFRLPPTLFLFF